MMFIGKLYMKNNTPYTICKIVIIKIKTKIKKVKTIASIVSKNKFIIFIILLYIITT